MPNCRQCKNTFEIIDRERVFYKKIEIPEPTLCVQCSWQNQAVFRNEKVLYYRKCDLCKKTTLSMIPQNTKYVVYCLDCWNSDKWSALDYGINYNSSRSFFDQLDELFHKVPRPPLYHSGENINCQYANYVFNNKTIYLGFSVVNSENIYYSRNIDDSSDLIDCMNCERCELLYECVDSRECYKSIYLQDCSGCTDSILCYDCIDCQHCFGCTNLRHKKYCWLNEQLTKEEYEKRLENWQDWIERARKYLQQGYRRYARLLNCENSTGDYLRNCKDCSESFFGSNGENCSGLWRFLDGLKGSWRSCFLKNSEELYNCSGTVGSSRVKWAIGSISNNDCEYINYCRNSENCFGCSVVRSKKYCILNKQYSEEGYRALRQKIIDQMRRDGSYGEFFPVSLSWFGYNETVAAEYFPISKEAASILGFKWQDNLPHTTGKETVTHATLPQNIQKVDLSITNEVLACNECKRNYKITPYELSFYKKQSISVPKNCFDCRHKARMAFGNPLKLWKRTCAKTGCKNAFETSYAPDRPEVVYCDSCYKSAVY